MAYKESAVITLPLDTKSHYVKFNSRVKFINRYVKVAPQEIAKRILASLAPPFTEKFKSRDVDLAGPVFAILFLTAVLHYGYQIKDPTATNTTIAPLSSVFLYSVLNPCLGFILCKIGQANIAFWDLTGLLGYALYSHILTLLLSLWIYQEESNAFFFICLFLFGGSSALRICVILIPKIPKPAARLLICSMLFISHLLYLIFLHFAYMHPTFIYGIGSDPRVPTIVHNNL